MENFSLLINAAAPKTSSSIIQSIDIYWPFINEMVKIDYFTEFKNIHNILLHDYINDVDALYHEWMSSDPAIPYLDECDWYSRFIITRW